MGRLITVRYEKRSNKSGTDIYYSFIKYSEGQQQRMTRVEIQNRFGKDIRSEDEAKKCLGMLEAEVESEKTKIMRVQEWKDKFFRFDELVADYTRKQKKKAPLSYANNVHYLATYVLPFFLSEERKLTNIVLWYSHFEEFKEYLESDARLIRTNRQLAYGSKNHAIKSLNTFLSHLHKEGILDNLRLCEYFEEYLLTQKTVDDVVRFEEFLSIESALNNDGHGIEADTYRCLYYTGMRVNEVAGVSLADVYSGEIEKKAFSNRLKSNNIKYYGFILLKSQPAGKNRTIRNKTTMKVERKPLKGRKVISEKDGRIIPIVDKNLWEIIVKRMRKLHEECKLGRYGSDASDYLVFEGFNKSTSMTRLKVAHEKTGIRLKTWHCLRHTRGTELFGETGDRELAKMWLGHGSNKVFEKYNHTYEEFVRSKKRSNLKKDEKFDEWFYTAEKSEIKKRSIDEIFENMDWEKPLPDCSIEINSK